MKDDIRNTRVVAGLIGGTTLGALILIALEPRAIPASGNILLAAESRVAIDSAAIDYAGSNQAPDLRSYDCVVWPNGDIHWDPQGSDIRIAVVGDESGQLSVDQSTKLLSVLGGLRYNAGLKPGQLTLADSSDAALHPDLPAQAHDLRALLVRKGLIR